MFGVDPTKVPLLGPSEWAARGGRRVGPYLGRAHQGREPFVYVSRAAGYSTYIHELLHVLFPSRPHYWIRCAATKLAGIPHSVGSIGRVADDGRFEARSMVPESKTTIIRLAKVNAKRKGLAEGDESEGGDARGQ